MTPQGVDPSRIDRLMDAIEFVKEDKREEARSVLRELIRENNDFEDAWLWMSVAVDSLDQSSICLDNVLRVNPGNLYASGALYRMREDEMRMEKRRSQLRFYRDISIMMMWLLVIVLLFSVLFSYPMMMP
ncbi:MAG: hypothetical protein H7Y09_14390 [Chitinophagaceae bacterium]|nr:hypothetical protein [Anaerolineae bacterium]